MDEHLPDADGEVNDQAIIDVLARLHPPADVSIANVELGVAEGHDAPALADETDDILAGWTADQLRAEVLRLRRAARDQGDATADDGAGLFEAAIEAQEPQASSSALVTAEAKPPRRARNKRKRADVNGEKPKTRRDEETGKRLEKGRRTELARAVRTRMRVMMGIGSEDPMPPPSDDPGSAAVPNWHAGLNDPVNLAFKERAATGMMDELRDGIWPKVPPEDMDPDIVRATCRTALLNFTKSYLARTDPIQQARKERYAKHRRRWARKDLKQKRRAKAASDPSFGDQPLHPTALHIDYMSSEYSSAGEDSDDSHAGDNSQQFLSHSDKVGRRAAQWAEEVRQAAQTASSNVGWAEGQGEKVLEVRTPLWRSPQLNSIYARLDAIAALQSSARSNPATNAVDKSSATRPGHVAPSHRRFTLSNEFKRRGKRPKEDGEGWMWSAGTPGVWPARVPQDLAYEGIQEAEGDDGDVARWADEVEAEVGTRGLVEVIEGIGT